MKIKALSTILASIFVLLFIFTSNGMTATGEIRGSIKVAGQPFTGFVYLPGKSVIAKTDDQGNYILYSVPVGLQSVKIEMLGITSTLIGTCQVLDQQTCMLNVDFKCMPGAMQSCPLQKGVCAGKVQTCTDGFTWSVCDYGPYYSQDELCHDWADNNCNGLIDENCW